MKTLYLDCQMGAAGDMLTAALIELFPEPGKMLEKLNQAGIPDVCYLMKPSVKNGIRGTHISVIAGGREESPDLYDHEDHHDHMPGHERSHDHGGVHGEHYHEHTHEELHTHDAAHHHAHGHSSPAQIEHIVRDHLNLPDAVKQDVLDVFGLIAQAESHVHGVPVPDIHFHEVGTMDAVADIAAVCMMMHELSPDEVIASPVHVGSGQIRCAHGTLPVPAPATAHILRGVPIFGGEIRGELCTPTGAALLKHFVTRFGSMPVMKTEAIGYGMGTKDFQTANCMRAMLGETEDHRDEVILLSCNIDDMTAEAVGYAAQQLLESGALEVYTVPVGMKKCRPGTLIRVLCKPEDKEKMVKLIFKHTSTIGIRETTAGRYVLERKTESIRTKYGLIRRKVSSGYGVRRVKIEHDDIARVAGEQQISLAEAKALLSEEL